MSDPRENLRAPALAAVLARYYPCICNEAYTQRDLIAPDCWGDEEAEDDLLSAVGASCATAWDQGHAERWDSPNPHRAPAG